MIFLDILSQQIISSRYYFNMDMQMISEFIFGTKFNEFVRILYDNMENQDVGLSKSDYLKYVNNAVFELSLDVLTYMKSVDLKTRQDSHKSSEKPKAKVDKTPEKPKAKDEKPKAKVDKTPEKPKAKEEKPKATGKCTFVLTRGPNKGAECGKTAHDSDGIVACSSHIASMKKDRVPADTDDEDSTPKKVSNTSSKTSSKDSTPKKCVYIMSRGARAGEKCGATAKEGDMCSSHLKAKGTKKDVVPCKKEIVKAKSVKAKDEKSDTVVLSRDKERNMIYHKGTGFVFRSADDKSIYGRVTIEKTKPVGEIRDLTQADIDEIEAFELPNGDFFKIDKMYNQESSDEETEEEAEEEAEEDDAECVAAAEKAEDAENLDEIEDIINELKDEEECAQAVNDFFEEES